MKRWTEYGLPVVVLACGVGVAVLLVRSREPARPEAREPVRVPVEVREVQPVDRRATVWSHGTVAPRAEVLLSAEVDGRVVDISPALVNGGHVGEGDEVVRLDPRDYELQVVQSEARLAEARARLLREQAEAEVARREWGLLGGGREAGPLTLREPQVAEALAALQSAEAALEFARLNLERTRIRAPFSARVTARRVDIGQYARRGEPVASMHPVDEFEVGLPVSVEDLTRLGIDWTQGPGGAGERVEGNDRTGFRVRLHPVGDPSGTRWEGRVARVEARLDAASRMATVVVRLPGRPGPSGEPAPVVGLFVEAEILGREIAGLYEIPREIVGEAGTVWIVDLERTLRPVSVSVVDGDRARVRVRGLSPGQRVCWTPVEGPYPGLPVEVISQGDAE